MLNRIRLVLHEALAGSFAILATALMLQQMMATPSETASQSEAKQVAQADLSSMTLIPPDLGVATEGESADDPLLPGGMDNHRADVETPERRLVDAAESAKTSVTEVAGEPAQSPPNPATADELRNVTSSTAAAATSTERLTEVAAWAPPLEESPLPASEMTKEQLRSTVQDYERWVHRGQITLLLDCSLLQDDELDAISSLYLIRSKHSIVGVYPDGHVRQLDRDDIPDNKLVGDLPRDRGRWPKTVGDAASRWLGPNHAGHLEILLSDETALEIYRTLAGHVGHLGPQPGREYHVRLRSVDRRMQCEFVRSIPTVRRS